MKTIERMEVTTEPESIVNNAPKLHATFSVGDVSMQGDLAIVCIASLPVSANKRENRQLAEGNTQGSRHVMTRGKVFDADKSEISELIFAATKCRIAEQYIGPVFISPNNPKASDLSHPEHGAQGFPAETICAVAFQRNLDADEREQRVRD